MSKNKKRDPIDWAKWKDFRLQEELNENKFEDWTETIIITKSSLKKDGKVKAVNYDIRMGNQMAVETNKADAAKALQRYIRELIKKL